MTNNVQKESATIIQFPVRSRGAAPLVRREPTHPGLDRPLSMAVAAALDGAWYHGAAVRDDQPKLARH